MERRFAPYLVAAATVCALTLGACGREAARNGPADAKAPAPPSTPSPSSKGDAERVTFTTDDAAGVAIVGDLYIPEKTPAPAILALHQFQANRATYAAFARTMRDSGFVVLAIDGRGFGDSKTGADGTVAPGWDTQGDIAAAIEYLKSQPSVDAQRIGLIGASYGASNALIFAADNPVDVRSAVLLSVGLNYHGSLPTEPALKKYGDRPLLMMAANDDAEDGPQTPALAIRIALRILFEAPSHDHIVVRFAESDHQPRGPPHLS